MTLPDDSDRKKIGDAGGLGATTGRESGRGRRHGADGPDGTARKRSEHRKGRQGGAAGQHPRGRGYREGYGQLRKRPRLVEMCRRPQRPARLSFPCLKGTRLRLVTRAASGRGTGPVCWLHSMNHTQLQRCHCLWIARRGLSSISITASRLLSKRISLSPLPLVALKSSASECSCSALSSHSSNLQE